MQVTRLAAATTPRRLAARPCRAPAGLVAALALALLAGCGGGGHDEPTPPPPAAHAEVRLLAAPKRPGEIVVRGDLSPASHGPFEFDGRYLVRFEQFAPEDPNVDFSRQTAFVAILGRHNASDDAHAVKLFRATARTGRRTLTLRGRLFVDVSFGDFPYALRFTPRR